jgi:hypothetical protein
MSAVNTALLALLLAGLYDRLQAALLDASQRAISKGSNSKWQQ